MRIRALRRRPSPAFAVAILALVVALGGVAYSAIPDQAGVITGCYTTGPPTGRTLRVIDTGAGESCTGAETALNWNQQGPAGPAGPAGPTGPQGPPGLPPAYTKTVKTFTLQGQNTYVPGDHRVEVARLNVPAGRYVVIAKTNATAFGPGSFRVTTAGCDLSVGPATTGGGLVLGQASDHASASLVSGGGAKAGSAMLVTMLAHEFQPREGLARPGAISLRCQPELVPSQDVRLDNTRIAAIGVADLPELQILMGTVRKQSKRVQSTASQPDRRR